MRVKFNKNEKVSITGMDKTLYYAIRNIIMSSEICFDEHEDNGEFYSNDQFVCCLSPEEKKALDRIEWDIS